MLPPVKVPVPTINLFVLSSIPMKALSSSPLSITIPASLEGVPVVPVPNSMSGSAIVVVVELTVVVVPLTVKFPDNTTLPENVCPLSASDLSSDDDTAFAAIWSAVIWASSICLVRILFCAIFALVTALSSILAVVTESPANLPLCIVPLAILAFVTCNAPICAVSILPSTKCSESIESSAIFAPVTASPAILPVVTCRSPKCIVSIDPVTSCAESTELLAI